MDTAARKRYDFIWDVTQTEPSYYPMFQTMGELEPKYDAVLQTLTPEQQDIICDYVALCEAMSQRMLEIACTLMILPPHEEYLARMELERLKAEQEEGET